MPKPLRCSVVLTTIGDPVLLDDYFKNFSQHGHLDQVEVFVIPDCKTPRSAFERCAALRARGMHIVCPPLEEQDAYLKGLGLAPEFLPRNSDNRRNVGYLMALQNGADFLISIDDDNYCPADEDYFAAHAVVCSGTPPQRAIEASTRWYNICDLLQLEPARSIYPRGFPYFARHKPTSVREVDNTAPVRINAGLWLGDPDLDGPTWMVAPVTAKVFKGPSVVLGPQTWSPVNSQNTALHRDAIAAYYFIRMGAGLGAFPIDRFGDIFSGFFVLACTRHLGYAARFGTPVAQHRRNSHNYIRDAAQEMAGIWLLEELLPWLSEARLEGSSFSEAYVSLSHQLEDTAMRFKGFLWTDEARAYIRATADRMREWIRACQCIGIG